MCQKESFINNGVNVAIEEIDSRSLSVIIASFSSSMYITNTAHESNYQVLLSDHVNM